MLHSNRAVTLAVTALIIAASLCTSGMAAAEAPETCGGSYMEENAERYEAYAGSHPKKSFDDVVIEVNLKLDEPNYENIVEVSAPERTDVMVSKHYALPLDYKPENLVAIDAKYAQPGVTLRSDCAAAMLDMAAEMEDEGLTLYIKSGYRMNIKRGGANSPWYAWPGHSEHQTGLAFDLRKKGVVYETLGEYRYQKTDEFAWLCENAGRYGFVLSFPKDMTHITGFGFEPWHWRYVGVDIATRMKDEGIATFQEYWAIYIIGEPQEEEKTVLTK